MYFPKKDIINNLMVLSIAIILISLFVDIRIETRESDIKV